MAEPSQQALNAQHQVDLLRQEMRALAEQNIKQDHEIASLKTAQDQTEGMRKGRAEASTSSAKFVGPGISVVAALLFSFFGSSIIGRMDELAQKHNEDVLSINASISAVRAAAAERALEAERREARVTANEVARESANRALAGIETEIAEMNSHIVAVENQMSSGQIEAETQIRSLNDVMNLEVSSIRQLVETVWARAMGTPLPQNDFRSDNIPAQATTVIGGGALKK